MCYPGYLCYQLKRLRGGRPRVTFQGRRWDIQDYTGTLRHISRGADRSPIADVAPQPYGHPSISLNG